MRELVKDQPRELAIGVVDEGVQQRVGERVTGQHPERRIRRHAVDADLEPERLQALGEGGRFGLVVVAAVADAADDREAPSLQRQAQFGCGDHVPERRTALQVGVAAVARVVGLAQRADGEIADPLTEFEPRFQGRARGRVGEPFGHRLRRAHDREVAADRLRVVAERAAARAQADRAGRQQRHANGSETRHAKDPPATLHDTAVSAGRTSHAPAPAGCTSTRQS